ncbi:magnesium transporter CorA family protein [Holdemania filiformis]|uniref:magnesium transporter CorA family protein n=1 Tax=Holdemania filiformis TaxID=61171 RepID=UPI00267601C1|nr:CorA family divalent cation transporter [Holdemania filiformis]
MIVEIAETYRTIEKLSYPCGHLTVGFISEDQLHALAAEAGLHLAVPEERESLMRNAVSVSEEAFWCVLHLINPGRILGQRDRIGLLILKNCFLVVDLYDEDDSTGEAVQRMLQTLRPEKATLPRLVAGFFREILIQDPDIHEDLEMQIDALEKEVFDARAPHFRQQTLQLGKELLTLNRYYEQLININEHLEENSNDLFAEDELRSFALLNERMLRYRDNVQLLRDRLTQAQQSYQAQLDYQLNKSMKTLSLVTTICLPLSLIAGWYGMNFTAMPELKWRYGYLYVIGLSAAVVSLVIILLKRKKG